MVSVQAGETITLSVSREGTTTGAITYDWSIVPPGDGTLAPYEGDDSMRHYTAPTGITEPVSVIVRVVASRKALSPRTPRSSRCCRS